MTIEDRVREFIGAQLAWEGEDRELTDDVELVRAGLIDSLRLMELAAFLTAEYGVDVEDIELTLDNFGTIAAIAGYVRRKTGAVSAKPAT